MDPDEAETLFRIQREASLAGLAHIFPPERYLEYPPHPVDLGYMLVRGQP